MFGTFITFAVFVMIFTLIALFVAGFADRNGSEWIAITVYLIYAFDLSYTVVKVMINLGLLVPIW